MRLTVEIDIPGVTEAQARNTVRTLDVLEAGEEDAIHLDKVKAADVLEALFSGHWNPDYLIMNDTMSDA